MLYCLKIYWTEKSVGLEDILEGEKSCTAGGSTGGRKMFSLRIFRREKIVVLLEDLLKGEKCWA